MHVVNGEAKHDSHVIADLIRNLIPNNRLLGWDKATNIVEIADQVRNDGTVLDSQS